MEKPHDSITLVRHGSKQMTYSTLKNTSPEMVCYCRLDTESMAQTLACVSISSPDKCQVCVCYMTAHCGGGGRTLCVDLTRSESSCHMSECDI
jgi:hypothetical protein